MASELQHSPAIPGGQRGTIFNPNAKLLSIHEELKKAGAVALSRIPGNLTTVLLIDRLQEATLVSNFA